MTSDLLPVRATILQKRSGTWKPVSAASVKVGGAWKTATGGWVRASGAWKRMYGIPPENLIIHTHSGSEPSCDAERSNCRLFG